MRSGPPPRSFTNRGLLGTEGLDREQRKLLAMTLPPEPTPVGLVSKDLVLDIQVDRSWHWKDRDDFYGALEDHILDPAVRAPIEAEAELAMRTEW